MKEFRDQLNQVILRLRNPEAWAQFCKTSGWLYQHGIVDQLLIYDQRPDAKAVAELKVWNRLGRSVKLGSKAIRLPTDHGLSRRNVFELSDTVSRNPAEPEFHLWQGEPYRDEVERILAGGSRREGADLSSLLFQAAYQQLEQYWERSGEMVLNTPAAGKISGTALYEQRQAFLYAGACSVMAAVAQRCGLEDGTVSQQDFEYIEEFNARARLQLATAVTCSASALLRQIQQAIEERSQEHEREDKQDEPEVHFSGRVPVPGGGVERPAEQPESAAPGQVRQDAGQLPGAGTAGPLRPDDVRRDAASLSDPARSAGPGENRDHGTSVPGKASGSPSEPQPLRMDRVHEQSEIPGRRAGAARADGLVTRNRTESQAVEQIGLFEEPEHQREDSSPQFQPNQGQETSAGEIPGAQEDDLDDVDPLALREALAKRGIVDGQLVDPEKLDQDPFLQQVMADVQQIAAQEAAEPPQPTHTTQTEPENFRITDDNLGTGGQKEKFWRNIKAIATLKQIEKENRPATPEEQQLLSQYVGWGGLADAFDPDKPAWAGEYAQLRELLTPKEYAAARASTLNAHYTSPTVIRAIYEAVGRMGFKIGKILEPSCGVGNFFGMLPEYMAGSKLYGVELDSISGRIAQQLYPKANITVAGFETTVWHDFFDLAIGNVPFGQYQVHDKAYQKLGFHIHNYFFAKALDQVRAGGLVAFVTSRYTMDAKDPSVRRYLAQRAELLGAIRLPNNAFRANAGTEVVSDILFLQKREQLQAVEPDWVQLGRTADGFSINQYYVNHPEMVLGKLAYESTQYGKEECTILPVGGESLAQQLQRAVVHLHGTYRQVEPGKETQGEPDRTLSPALPQMAVNQFAVVNGVLYYKGGPNEPPAPWTGPEGDRQRIAGMVEIRTMAQKLIDCQMTGGSDGQVIALQEALSGRYDRFAEQYGTLNSRKNRSLFADDNGAYLLLSLEEQDADGHVMGKSDFFSKRTIRPQRTITHCDTPQDALAVALNKTGRVDLERMGQLTGMSKEELLESLRGVVYHDPAKQQYVTAEAYLSGNVRRKLEQAREAAARDGAYSGNVQALEAVQPDEITADQIDVRLGAVWIDPKYIRDFLIEVFQAQRWANYLEVKFLSRTGEWHIEGKKFIQFHNRVLMEETYGTNRMNAVEILERTLNLRDVQVTDTVERADGSRRTVLNLAETVAARVKQEQLQTAFRDWIFEQPQRRGELTREYNRRFNSFRNRSYDGSHLTFPGMTPEIALRPHQINAIARALYGGNTLLAHVVGAGKTFEMVAIAMEAKRIGLTHKSMIVVPNHLTEQWGTKFLQLYPAAQILVATRADFTPERRKRFCTRIATGDWDAVIIGHSQFERIPLSQDYQESFLREQIDDLDQAIRQASRASGEKWTVKALERSRKRLEVRLQKLQDSGRKDDTLPFEALG